MYGLPVELLSTIVNLFGILFGAGIVVLQLRSQHNSGLELQRDNAEKEFSMTIFNILSDKNRIAQDKLCAAQNLFRLLPINFKNYLFMKNTLKIDNPTPVSERADKIAQLHFEASQSIIEIIFTIEKYEILYPQFKIFQLFFSKQLNETQNAFNELYSFAIQFLPFDVPEEKQKSGFPKYIMQNPPNEDQLEKMESLTNEYIKISMDTAGFLFDLNVEAQNQILGKISRNRIAPRQPEDPGVVVITLDGENKKRIEELKKALDKKRV